jgi:hypothetical protein
LLVCSLAVSGIVGAGRGVPAWRRWDADVRARAADQVRELRMLEAGMERLPAMRDSVAARRRRLDSAAVMLLEGESPAQAGAALAAVASDLAAESGVQVNAVQVRADSVYRGHVTRVAVRVSATGDVTGLTELLQQLEGHDLLLHVRELVVTQQAPAAPDNVAEALRVELLVEGLALRPRGRT